MFYEHHNQQINDSLQITTSCTLSNNTSSQNKIFTSHWSTVCCGRTQSKLGINKYHVISFPSIKTSQVILLLTDTHLKLQIEHSASFPSINRREFSFMPMSYRSIVKSTQSRYQPSSQRIDQRDQEITSMRAHRVEIAESITYRHLIE
jgi:hypothetical protein